MFIAIIICKFKVNITIKNFKLFKNKKSVKLESSQNLKLNCFH